MSPRLLHQDDSEYLESCASTLNTDFPDYFPDAPSVIRVKDTADADKQEEEGEESQDEEDSNQEEDGSEEEDSSNEEDGEVEEDRMDVVLE